ncbi:MAG: molecular chaperone DnaK [Candidatus Aminicenantes bacterium]|nr:molecular chaperone DnaK [Candidatus Aminicenantes bacterium]NIM80098.1 molecular chaperone DnaK [Candidatus Aminicenantes bacterium]NIN19436.1 molecular chaperone DnaK [Candidatus Aminicenantes bacterium]NIN43336.1 molecular chaperone DnaK [Candidatus Aminicenantes bacterium]NIN86080.1 molecular chaperone DnaK [Candidatus Aminicenantes bacterium]
MAKNIGIDLGTTNSCISYLEGPEPVIIPNPEGSRVIPSLVALTRDNRRIFGNIAKRQFITNNENTIWGVKRLIGRKYDTDEVRVIQQRVSYAIYEAENGDTKVKLGEKLYSPEEISAMLLGYLKQIAQEYLGEEIADTVVTVPAFFNDAQRQGTKVAGEIAGLNVTRIINEPTAALIAYKKKITRDGLYAVYDLGGGTFDISIVEVQEDIYKVVSTTGDTFLGGNDFDEIIIEWMLNEIKKDISIDIISDKNTVQRIIQVAEKAKIELSFNQETQINIPYLHRLPDGTNYHFEKKLTRTQLEHDTAHLVEKTLNLIQKSLDKINITKKDIEKVILVGGQSRMPIIYDKITKFFGKEPFIDLNPEEVVAQGAVLQAEVIKGSIKDILLLDVTSLSLGVETKGDRFTKIIDANSTIPIKKTMRFTTITDNQQTVTIHVLQGERELASENKSLGYFNLVGIPMAPKGIPQIDVTFQIDANGIVKVSAKEAKTGLVQSMKIQPASGMSPEEIEKLKKDARVYEEQDKIKIKLNQVKLQLEEELGTIRFFYERHTKKLSPKEKSELKTLISRSEKALEEEELDSLETSLLKVQSQREKINQILISEFEG